MNGLWFRVLIAVALVGVMAGSAVAAHHRAHRAHHAHRVVAAPATTVASASAQSQKTYTLRYYGGPKSPMWPAPQ